MAADGARRPSVRITENTLSSETVIAVLSGVPVPHGPEDHRVFHVATEDYRDHRLEGVEIPGMGNGFLDGVNAGLVGQGMASPLRAGVLLTPAYPRAPDVEGTIRLIEAARTVYGLDVDTGDLEAFAAEIEEYHRDLAGRLESVESENRPEKRMHM